MNQIITSLLVLYFIPIYKLNATTNNWNENKEIEQTYDISDNSIYQYGVFKINKRLYIHNLDSNVQAYLKSKRWNHYQYEEFRHSYLIIIEALKDENRLSADSFGTITDKEGQISNADKDDYWYDNKGNRITGLEYRNLSTRKQKKYRAFHANQEVASYFNIIAQALIEELNKKKEVTTSTKPTIHYAQRVNNYDIKIYGNEDITIRRTSVTYDPHYNMCVTLNITNNTNKKLQLLKSECITQVKNNNLLMQKKSLRILQ